MGTRFTAESPDKHDYTLTMTLPLKDWLQVRDQICGNRAYAPWPSSTLADAISDMAAQAKKIYWTESE